MASDLTVRQRKWLANYLQTGNAAESAGLAGYKGDAQQLAEIGYQNSRKLQMEIGDMMGAMGLDDGALLGCLKSGLSASKAELAQSNGIFQDERIYPDYSVRAKYLDIALRLKGKYPSGHDSGDAVAALVVLRSVLGIESQEHDK